jgi:hypothetical protein
MTNGNPSIVDNSALFVLFFTKEIQFSPYERTLTYGLRN